MSSSYVVLARKWRSAQFSDIVGQSHIVRTLNNAIRSERVHQAYLFTGSRGIGKTSIARIFAKVLRCEKTTTDPQGWLRSCDECSSCKEITAGTGIDVIEIDGASNNGVEAVREIRENAKYLPAVGSRKIYIIDEVHMLTTAAFNALLKTLEEPPAHVIFIFATTEPHKIPATILSRCQRFDYRRISVAQIQAHLLEVIRTEKLSAEPAALSLIARAAEGSMRDALSLLDQVIAFSTGQITASSVRESTGLVEGQMLTGILRAIYERKPLDALALVEQAYSRGHDLRVLTKSLIEYLHGSILVKVGATGSATLELPEEEWKELCTLSGKRPLEEIELIFQVFHHGLEWIARSPQPKVVLDVLIVKCATAEALVYVASAGTEGTGKSASPEHPPKEAAKNPAEVKSSGPAPVAAIIAARTETKSYGAPADPESGQNAGIPKDPNPSWEGFIESVRTPRPLLASILEHGTSSGLSSNDCLVIYYSPKDAYFRDQLQSRVYHEQLLSLSREYFGKPVQIQLELKEGTESPAQRREREALDRKKLIKERALNHPILVEAKSLFGGELGPIDVLDSERDLHADL